MRILFLIKFDHELLHLVWLFKFVLCGYSWLMGFGHTAKINFPKEIFLNPRKNFDHKIFLRSRSGKFL